MCSNPHCTGRRCHFLSEKAFGIHLQSSTTCFRFLQQQQMHAGSDAKPPVSLLLNVRIGSMQAAAQVQYSSTYGTRLLKRDFTNVFSDDILQRDTTGAMLDDNEFCTPLQSDQTRSNTRDAPMHTTEQKWTIALLKILDDMNAPDYAFNEIMSWANQAKTDGYSFEPEGGFSRRGNVEQLFATTKNATQLLPTVTAVAMPHGPPCDVIMFDFVPQLLQLLQNQDIMIQQNLLIDVQNPLCPYSSTDGLLGDALSGQVYQDAYNRLITDPSKQLFVPIIQWIDQTSVTGNDRFSLKPYIFTPAIFTEQFRRTINAWGYHGFLPKAKLSSAQNQILKPGDNIRNYHAQLSAVLSSFCKADARLLNIKLPIGPHGVMNVDIITCLLFVIQDMQEGDSLCGRYGPHTPQIQRHCRSCNVLYNHLDLPKKQCRYLYAAPMAMIANSDDTELRTKWSQHNLNNAFDSIMFADSERGIFGATPVETMHAYRKGLIEYVTYFVLDNVPASRKAAFDRLAIHFHTTHRQTFRKTYPATDFSRGITNLTKISARERLGLVFLFVILAQSDEGWDILTHTFRKHPNTSVADVIQVFEAMLCFDAWLMQTTFWAANDTTGAKDAAQRSIQKLLAMCRAKIPVTKATGWKFPKFHEMLHIVDDIARFGAPRNFNAERPESLLIAVAKRPGRRAQKRHAGSLYELQSAQRLSESFMISTVYARIWHKNSDAAESVASDVSGDQVIWQSSGNATFATITSIPQAHQSSAHHISIEWQTKTNLSYMQLPEPLVHYLITHFGPKVIICTEYVRDVYTFRCHPSYQSQGAINDWVNVQFNQGCVCPCKLVSVVILDSDLDNPERYRLVVQPATSRSKQDSVLLQEWNWSPEYCDISPNSIAGPCFVIDIGKDSSKILVTKPYDEWAQEFTDQRYL